MSATLLLLGCLVIGVSDGDSLRVKCPTRASAFVVRLAGIDAPEIEHKAFRIAEQPGGREAKASLADLCLKKTADVKRIGFDRYRRAIAFVSCAGIDASTRQLATGNAWSFLPPKALRPSFAALEKSARDQGIGLWAEPDPVEPSIWRRRAPTPISAPAPVPAPVSEEWPLFPPAIHRDGARA